MPNDLMIAQVNGQYQRTSPISCPGLKTCVEGFVRHQITDRSSSDLAETHRWLYEKVQNPSGKDLEGSPRTSPVSCPRLKLGVQGFERILIKDRSFSDLPDSSRWLLGEVVEPCSTRFFL